MDLGTSEQAVRLGEGAFWLHGKPTFLLGGELHYFRLDRAVWEERIAQAKAMGLNTIGSYIPWIWHEPQAGRFDFTGATHPQRDLAAFMRLVQEAGMYFLARVGPVSNAELVGEGIPPWLFEGQPELQLKRADGSYMRGMPSYRHPGFLARVEAWYGALAPVLAPYLMDRGGNIPLVQLCNEIDMPTWLSRQPDHHAHVEAAYAEFEGAPSQPDGTVPAWPSALHTRWHDFYADHFAWYVAELSARMPANAVPVLVNLAQWTDHEDRGRGNSAPMTSMMFRDMALAHPAMVLGGDYYPRHIDYENFHDIGVASDVVRMISARGAPVVSPELMAGVNEDRPRIFPADIELVLHASAAQGLNLLNLYMLAGGRNPEGIGVFGAEHDWQAPIAPDGSLRPSAAHIEAFARAIAAHPRYAASQKVPELHIGFYAPYFQTEYLKGPAIEDLERRRVQHFQDGLLRLFALENFSLDFVDLGRAPTLPTDRPLWVYSEDWMDAATQSRLADHVTAGGRLALCYRVPSRDEHGASCTILAQRLGLSPSLFETRFVHGGGTTLPLHGEAQVYATAPSDEVLMTTDDGGATVLWRPVGTGGVLLMGFGMRHRFDRQASLLTAWAARLGLTPALVLSPDIIGMPRIDGDTAYLHLFNYLDEARPVSGHFTFNGKTHPLAPFELPRRSARLVKLG